MVNQPANGRKSPTPAQLRAARAALGLSLPDLAGLSGLGLSTLKRAEKAGLSVVTQVNAERIVSTLEGHGIVFLDDDGSGVGLRFSAA